MARYTISLLFLLGCSISVRSTMGSGLRLNSKMQQNESIDGDHILSDLAQDVLDINKNDHRNLQGFTFPYEPNVPSCQGRQAKRMQKQYDRKLAQWESFNPNCYNFTFEKVCFRCADLQPVQVTVVNGVISTVQVAAVASGDISTTIDTDEPIGMDDIEQIPTMKDLYDQLRNCISDCQDGFIHQCKVKFSKGTSGVIRGLYTDGDAAVMDEEYYVYYVRDFQTC